MSISRMMSFIGLVSIIAVIPIVNASTEKLQPGIAKLDPSSTLKRVDDKPLENIPGVETLYTAAQTQSGKTLRVLISKPYGSQGKHKPLFFTQWVSCGSVEYRKGGSSYEILATLAREAGLALVRVERSGSGDSEGKPCSELGYNEEVKDYIDVFSTVLSRSDIDSKQLYFFGSSLGSTTAPLVAKALQDKGFSIGGVAVTGGGALTHFERMLNFDRIYMERRPDKVSREDIHSQMYDRTRFHTEYLIRGRKPDDIVKDDASLKTIRQDVRGLGPEDHYGRPFSWHQEAAEQNFLSAWASLKSPVLVVFNEFDQFETEKGHALIADTVNLHRPGSARFVKLKKTGHSHYRYPSIYEAYENKNGKPAWEEIAGLLREWFKDIRK